MESQALYVFWKYDVCPYVLGAEVLRFCGSLVEPKGYDGYRVKPLAIIEGEDGRLALENLKELRAEFHEKHAAIRSSMAQRARELIGVIEE